MSLQNFAQQNTGPTSIGSSPSGGSSLSDFAAKKTSSIPSVGIKNPSSLLVGEFGEDAKYLPRNVDEARKIQKDNPTLWERLSKNLLKPQGVLATITDDLGKSIGDLAYGSANNDKEALRDAGKRLTQTPKKIGGIITGTREKSFSDIWNDAAKNNLVSKEVASVVGLTIDLTADPLNFVGIGALTKSGQVTKKAQNLMKAGEVIKEGSQLHSDLKKLGLLEDINKLKLGATKAEQVKMGQRALLSFMANTGWEQKIAKGARLYEYTGALSNGIKQTKAAQIVSKVFSTKTSDEAFNQVKNHFDNLNEYRKGEAMNEALKIQKAIGDLPQEEALRVISIIENAGGNSIKVTDDASAIAFRLQENFKIMKGKEEAAGLLKTDIQDYFPHIKTKQRDPVTGWKQFKSLFQKATGEATDKPNLYGDAKVYSTNLPSSKARKIEGTVESINEAFGTKFFEDRPAIAFAQRAIGHAKAVTSKEFFESVKQFGIKAGEETLDTANFVGTKIKDLDGLKFAPDIAEQLQQYQRKIKPEELDILMKAVNAPQNIWKAQALIAPSYHIRNMVGNAWNNFLAGVRNPVDYIDATKIQNGKAVNFTDEAGRVWDQSTLMKAAKQSGVIDEGWYAKDIETSLASELGGTSFNPLKQNFSLYKANRQMGSALENNSRLAHFINKIKQGNSIDDAALSVKKYLFDYSELTWTEQNLFKTVMPFYTWTRKNIPLQLEKLVTEPAKFGAIAKTVNTIEENVPEPNEKYLGDYIKNNIGIRVGNDEKGNTFYFLLGSWLPSAQAIDFLSQPSENFITMISPFFKLPVELWSNQSFFFEDTFGKQSQIERYEGENTSFLGFTMRKKTSYVLKNIRILNELDKLNPGEIFGTEDTPSLAGRIAPELGFKAPFGIGHITTSEQRSGKSTPEGSQATRILQSMFGKTSLYNPNFAKKFYLWDTDTKVRELERAIKDARRDGQDEYAKRLRDELISIKKER